MLKLIQKTALVGAIILSAGAALADYPEKPIQIIVGFDAGGGTDVMARTATPFIEKYLGEGASLVVKNVPGASGQIGITETAGADPDGYTIGTFNLPGMMARTIDRKSAYDVDSFTYLANVVNDPNVIVTSKRGDLDTLEKLIAEATANPGAVTVGMSSLGGDDHFMLIKLQQLTGAEFTIVPFSGSAPARTALMGGHVAMGILNISEVAEFQEELNVLGVAQAERSPFAPDLPTFKEQGLDLLNGSMRGFVAPAGLPAEVEAKLVDAFGQLAGDEEFQAAMAATANPVEVVTGAEFKALTASLYDLAKGVWETTPWN
ncbi:MAG: tripartite tricarboxylate transporter substrate binding protein [Alphaproteobacteria bacterium]|nr:tripartite tricarboxylate transporter substrate binding protein [Alphaproteobacteria bacterium]MBU1280778.1 tripartite tricarboxylate transporter substrate binding protein [Alphaproteobacteria bacterium]MBU1575202.1 tripartite tricarboxylate transporter substrate binding protein [Alphaproteobacteria bacterium]MBU1827136.1 tripartite tricarboxylate transporter substrate binding protein [Alphaproteobacteria bacterium]MBU2076740.1 tripartite tricarboxylate transporter substrate binding protein 